MVLLGTMLATANLSYLYLAWALPFLLTATLEPRQAAGAADRA
ncbi:MAG: hypothetical protein ACR2NA_03390 [Solirubrobacterales bacterium]